MLGLGIGTIFISCMQYGYVYINISFQYVKHSKPQ